MMVYNLKCSHGHQFEQWFKSSNEYEELKAESKLSCKECGDSDVTKAIMAPNVAGSKNSEPAPAPAPAGPMCGMGGCGTGMCGL
ncbi:DUF1178 family protein [Magnetospira sp. QH-2]|uniref:DUF1178 family protein n=1 Tax=Magnetospira sp. (strain QH-2) TaxID=1288970 RepID=UPI0003E814BD|nr:DUF1178 family protein [Magnetospira sp. QH-2]CCQ72049.1 conserved protein of unknown function [Magnetospira sp. QH-2]